MFRFRLRNLLVCPVCVKIVIGRSSAIKTAFAQQTDLTEKLIDYAPNLDVHIISDTVSNAAVYQKKGRKRIISYSLSLIH